MTLAAPWQAAPLRAAPLHRAPCPPVAAGRALRLVRRCRRAAWRTAAPDRRHSLPLLLRADALRGTGAALPTLQVISLPQQMTYFGTGPVLSAAEVDDDMSWRRLQQVRAGPARSASLRAPSLLSCLLAAAKE